MFSNDEHGKQTREQDKKYWHKQEQAIHRIYGHLTNIVGDGHKQAALEEFAHHLKMGGLPRLGFNEGKLPVTSPEKKKLDATRAHIAHLVHALKEAEELTGKLHPTFEPETAQKLILNVLEIVLDIGENLELMTDLSALPDHPRTQLELFTNQNTPRDPQYSHQTQQHLYQIKEALLALREQIGEDLDKASTLKAA